jgi:glycosyltransferase involved in cell wall biosynthesis
MRVLHVGSGNLYGGVETQLLTMARFRQVCPGMEQQFAFSFEGKVSQELKSIGVPVYHLGDVRVSRPWTMWRSRKRLKALIHAQRYDAIICHSPWALAVFGPAVRASARLVFWMHDFNNGRNWLGRWVRTTVPDLAICNSRFTATSLQIIFPKLVPVVINCPVELDHTSTNNRLKIRELARVRDNEVVILQISRMEAQKGHDLHLRALAHLKDLPSWRCWFVGGPQRPKEHQYLRGLQETAAALAISDRVEFLGQRSDVPDLLAAADIFCQPNQSGEAFGIVFVEALLAGLPVVSTAMGGALEIVDSSCGVLVPPADPKALARSLRDLIESKQWRDKLGACGPSRAKQLSNPNMQLEALERVLCA